MEHTRKWRIVQARRGLLFALRELGAVLRDSWQAADLRGRLRAWREIASGRVVIE